MAGLFPDAPGPRMAWHRDGSTLLVISQSNVISEQSASVRNELNDEDDAWAWSKSGVNESTWDRFVIIFPELRDLVGYYLAHGDNANSIPSSMSEHSWSADTTTGLDGTWTTIGGGSPTRTRVTSGAGTSTSVNPTYRTVASLSITGAKAIRFRFTGGSGGTHYMHAWHLYGTPNTAATRYLMLTDTGGTEVTGPYFDMGDDPRGGPTEDKQFKVKNGHGTLTANTVTVSFSAPVDKSPSFADDYTFSSDGSTFTSSLSLGNLAPGASSGTLYVRRTTPSAAALGLETGIIVASAASWS